MAVNKGPKVRFRLPRRFKDAELSSLDVARFADLLAYVEGLREHVKEGTGILLCGPVGVGKTWAIAALTKWYVKVAAKMRVSTDHEFVTAPDMFDNLDEFAHEYDEYRHQSWLQTYSSVPWLVINDLGKEYRGGKLEDQVAYRLGRVLRARSEKALPTFITSNLDGKEIQGIYGTAIASLLSEMVKIIVVRGPDLRRVASSRSEMN